MTRKKINGKCFTTAEQRIIWKCCEQNMDAGQIQREHLPTRKAHEIQEQITLLRGMDQFCPTQYMIPTSYRPDSLGSLPARLIAPTPERKMKGEDGW
jgi:hypothetical protein